MKAIIEKKECLYLIRIYESNGVMCDTYVVENIYYSEEDEEINAISNNWYEEVKP